MLRGSQRAGPSEASISSRRVLCETVKDFVARVGKAYEKTTESSEESEVMAKKVGPGPRGWGASGRGGTPPLLPPFPPVLRPQGEAGLPAEDPGR